MKITLKFLSFYIFSIGFFLLKFDWINYVFECTCKYDTFPKYYTFPFIYKSENLAFSMAEVFYISGILLNGLVITLILLCIDFCIVKWIRSLNVFSKIYVGIKVLLLVCSFASFYFSYTFFRDDDYEWNSNFRRETESYKANCTGYFDGILIP